MLGFNNLLIISGYWMGFLLNKTQTESTEINCVEKTREQVR